MKQISNREQEVLDLIAAELTTKEIASQLFISHHTVISHRKNLYEKLCAKNTAGLIIKSVQQGWLSIPINRNFSGLYRQRDQVIRCLGA